MAQQTERWEHFLECVCFNSSTMSLCQSDVGDPTVGIILTQCAPYFEFLLVQALYFLIAGVLAMLSYLAFLICRCAGACGGIHPSHGYCTTSERRRFPGYSRRTVILSRLAVFVVLIGAVAMSVFLFVANRNINASINELVLTTNTFADQVMQASSLAGTLFSALPGLPESLLAEVATISGTVSEFASVVIEIFDIIGNANGNHKFGRTQLVTIAYAFVFFVMLLGATAGAMGITLRGWLHPFLATLLMLSSLLVLSVAVVHTLLYFILNDGCLYINQILSDASAMAETSCGEATVSMSSLLTSASQDTAAFECNAPASNVFGNASIPGLCEYYFSCALYNGCLEQVLPTVQNLSTTLVFATLATDPFEPLLECIAPQSTCNNDTVAQWLANQTFTRVLAETVILDQIQSSIVPLSTCQINYPTLSAMMTTLCGTAIEAENVAWGTSALFCLATLAAFLFTIGGKRFNARNLRPNVLRRRLKRMLKSRGFVKDEIDEILGLTDFCAIDRLLAADAQQSGATDGAERTQDSDVGVVRTPSERSPLLQDRSPLGGNTSFREDVAQGEQSPSADDHHSVSSDDEDDGWVRVGFFGALNAPE